MSRKSNLNWEKKGRKDEGEEGRNTREGKRRKRLKKWVICIKYEPEIRGKTKNSSCINFWYNPSSFVFLSLHLSLSLSRSLFFLSLFSSLNLKSKVHFFWKFFIPRIDIFSFGKNSSPFLFFHLFLSFSFSLFLSLLLLSHSYWIISVDKKSDPTYLFSNLEFLMRKQTVILFIFPLPSLTHKFYSRTLINPGNEQERKNK